MGIGVGHFSGVKAAPVQLRSCWRALSPDFRAPLQQNPSGAPAAMTTAIQADMKPFQRRLWTLPLPSSPALDCSSVYPYIPTSLHPPYSRFCVRTTKNYQERIRVSVASRRVASLTDDPFGNGCRLYLTPQTTIASSIDAYLTIRLVYLMTMLRCMGMVAPR
nr:hypothetical protein CFP56_00871 [Quercus suber]